MVDVDLQSINEFLLPDLGKVTLAPYLTVGSNPPTFNPPAPSIMLSPILVPSSSYRWNYTDIRLLRLGYLLERDGVYEYGDIHLLSEATTGGSVITPPYVPAAMHVVQSVIISTGSVGVSLSFATDSLSVNPQFGMAYQITSTLPAVYPTLRVFVVKTLPIEV